MVKNLFRGIADKVRKFFDRSQALHSAKVSAKKAEEGFDGVDSFPDRFSVFFGHGKKFFPSTASNKLKRSRRRMFKKSRANEHGKK